MISEFRSCSSILLALGSYFDAGVNRNLAPRKASPDESVTLSTTSVSSRRRCATARLLRAHCFAVVRAASCALRRSLSSPGHPNHGFGPNGQELVWAENQS